MSICQAYGCGFSVEEILISLDNGEKKIVLCPNHIILSRKNLFHDENIYSETSIQNLESISCECCGGKGVIEYKDNEAVMYLCSEHLSKLIHHNLSPKDFKTLYAKHGNIYVIHDDFYDPRSGEALQPVE